MATFPQLRLRRLRGSEGVRRMVRETQLSSSDFIYPLFVCEGENIRNPIEQMPGCYQLSLDQLLIEVAEVVELGIESILLFGIPAHKDGVGSEAYASRGIIQQALRAIKQAVPRLCLVTDVCLCEYTDHGHCGVVKGSRIDNDATLSLMARIAVSHAEAGADVVAPSAMMDGQVGAIRSALDVAGHDDTLIMAYAAKYSSAFYGPFRAAAESTPQFGDRQSYQMDPANRRMALREVEQDIHEGADMVMVKPALSYLDIITRVRERFSHPVVAYNVSGEYSMLKAAAARGWIEEPRAVLEVLIGIKRAGADLILTYHAKDAILWIRGDKWTA